METRGGDNTQRIVIVRHGQTAWSVVRRHTGRSDLPLDAVGREQAGGLAAGLGTQRFAEVLVSPLTRARETAALAGFGDTAVVDADLIEWDYGAYEGMTSEEIQVERPGWTLFADGTIGGESIDDVAARARRVIDRVHAVSGDVLLIGHGHQLRILTALWLELPPAAGERFDLRTAAPSTLGWDDGTAVLLSWNGLRDR